MLLLSYISSTLTLVVVEQNIIHVFVLVSNVHLEETELLQHLKNSKGIGLLTFYFESLSVRMCICSRD